MGLLARIRNFGYASQRGFNGLAPVLVWWLLLSLLIIPLKTEAQTAEIDTLQYFDPDSLGYCDCVLGNVEGWYMRFDPPEGWETFDVLEAELFINDHLPQPFQDMLFFGSDSGILADTGYYHAAPISILDSTDVYPNWKSIDLSKSNLNDLSDALWIKFKNSYSLVLCDTTNVTGHTFLEVVWPPNTLDPFFEGAIRLIVQKSETVGIETEIDISAQRASDEPTISIFPNPTNSHAIINVTMGQGGINQESVLTIYDLSGKSLYRQIFNFEEGTNVSFRWPEDSFQSKSIPSGIYLIVFSGGGHKTAEKLMIIK